MQLGIVLNITNRSIFVEFVDIYNKNRLLDEKDNKIN